MMDEAIGGLAEIVRKHTVAGGYTNGYAIASEAFEHGMLAGEKRALHEAPEVIRGEVRAREVLAEYAGCSAVDITLGRSIPSSIAIRAMLAFASPGREAIAREVFKVLRNFKMTNMAEEDDPTYLYPLVDLCSRPDMTVEDGEEQIGEMAAEIADALCSLAPSPVGEGNPCAKIFDHLWLDLECVEQGCKSLFLKRAIAALRKLTFSARTSGGTAGRDDHLMAACDEAEAVIATLPPIDKEAQE